MQLTLSDLLLKVDIKVLDKRTSYKKFSDTHKNANTSWSNLALPNSSRPAPWLHYIPWEFKEIISSHPGTGMEVERTSFA
jgi:hypothetical protein